MTSQRPTLELERGDDCGPLTIDVCADRACSRVVAELPVSAGESSARPAEPLPKGVAFWRARSGNKSSHVWQFTVGADTPVDTWWGTIPDFNGDGLVDVAVGSVSGVVVVYYGAKEGLGNAPTRLEVSGISNLLFGAGLASAGDVNGDGYADLLVGAPVKGQASDKENAGGAGSRLYVFAGGADGVAREPTSIMNYDAYILNVRNAQGASSDMRGGVDINYDGFADAVVTTPTLIDPERQTIGGGVFVQIDGSKEGARIGRTHYPDGELGGAVAFCDLNADRRSDLVLGAPVAQGERQDEALPALVYRASGISFELQAEVTGAAGGAWSIGCADFSGDGYPDVIAGNPYSQERGYLSGDLLFYANTSRSLATAGVSVPGQGEASNYVLMGLQLTIIGDMNGDGRPDFSAGHEFFSGGRRLFFGVAQGGSLGAISLDVPPESAEFWTAATGGDLDGDGLADAVLSIARLGTPARGRVSVFRGNSRVGVDATPTIEINAPNNVSEFGAWLSQGL